MSLQISRQRLARIMSQVCKSNSKFSIVLSWCRGETLTFILHGSVSQF